MLPNTREMVTGLELSHGPKQLVNDRNKSADRRFEKWLTNSKQI